MEQTSTDSVQNHFREGFINSIEFSPGMSSSLDKDSRNNKSPGTTSEQNTLIPKSHLDFLDLIFPPTPEKSPETVTFFNAVNIPEGTTRVIVEPAVPDIITGLNLAGEEDQLVAVPLTPLKESLLESVLGTSDHQSVPHTSELQEFPSRTHTELEQTVEEHSKSEVDAEENSNSPNSSASKATTKPKRLTKALIFPPCFICSGKASGSHYGVNSCEACKGFFRRYAQKKEEYKCTKGGNCEITSKHRGNCSGCRLKKCLALGMSKEKSKMGRYTLSKRTETIKSMNRMAGKDDSASVSEEMELLTASVNSIQEDSNDNYNPESEIIGRKICQNSQNLNISNGFSSALVAELVEAMDEIRPYGPDVSTDEHLQEKFSYYAELYKRKIELYGRMKTIPKDEYYKLYKNFGIDVDGRMDDIKHMFKYVEETVERYCKFAKHIPGFYRLPVRDQANILKSSRADFFIIIAHKTYSKEHRMFLCNTGKGYHEEELVDKFFSHKLMTVLINIYLRWQSLKLSKEEMAIIAAMTLGFTDRCKLESHAQVESIQFALTDLLRSELQKKCKETAQRRFMKIIDLLTLMRDGSELYLQEYKQLCDDEVLVEEVPMLTEFLLEDNDNTEK